MGLVLLVFLHSTWTIQTWTLGERRKRNTASKIIKTQYLDADGLLMSASWVWLWFSTAICCWQLEGCTFSAWIFQKGYPPRSPPPQFRPRRQIEAEDLVTPGIDPSSNTFKAKISSLEVRWVPFLLDLYIWCTHVQKEIRTFKVAV